MIAPWIFHVHYLMLELLCLSFIISCIDALTEEWSIYSNVHYVLSCGILYLKRQNIYKLCLKIFILFGWWTTGPASDKHSRATDNYNKITMNVLLFLTGMQVMGMQSQCQFIIVNINATCEYELISPRYRWSLLDAVSSRYGHKT